MVIRLDTSDTKALADVLGRAFYAEPLFTYMVPDERVRRALLPWFLSAAIRASHFCGEIYDAGPGGRRSLGSSELHLQHSAYRAKTIAVALGEPFFSHFECTNVP
jgi:hypothetical protein